MNLPPALTWLQLLSRDAACACATGPQWFRDMLAASQRDARAAAAAGGGNGGPAGASRVQVLWGTAWHEMADLPRWDTVVAINCPGVTTRRLETSGFAYARRYAVLPSLEKARWFINLDTGAVAAASFSVYTPARRSAHLKKAVAKLLARARVPGWYKDQVVIASRRVPPLERKLAELFPGQSLRVGLSAGAPEPALNRKASGAVMAAHGEILAFVKIAGSPLSRRIMEHEAEMLPALAERARTEAATPRLLFAGEIDGRYVTVQSPLPGKPAPTALTPAHERYLGTLRSGQVKPAAATQMVAELPGRIAAVGSSSPSASALDLGGILDEVMPVLERLDVPSTIVHGDFAPWNLRLHGGKVSAFDWEYGQLDGLPLIDETHFRVQLGFQLQGWNTDQFRACLAQIADARPLGMTPEQVRAIHVVYLLDNIVRLLGEGYPADDEMVAWYARLMGTLVTGQREATAAPAAAPAPAPEAVPA